MSQMRISSIKAHLRPYSIYQKRKTTINHAFASALAPFSEYSEQALSQALSMLGQSVHDDLVCVYCESPAKTWDHLTGLVKDSELHGFGHQLGNLVPSCSACNFRKGNRDWRDFVEDNVPEPRRSFLLDRLESYQEKLACRIDMEQARTTEVELWEKYDAIKAKIHSLMQEADSLAATLRSCVRGPAV
jgi:hypothetical protein